MCCFKLIYSLYPNPKSSEVAVAPILGLVIPVYRGQTVFFSASNSAQKSVAKALRTLVFSARPADVVSCVTTNCADIRSCEGFGLKCVKLEEYKDGYSVDLLFSSPETLEKHYECLSNLSENILGVY